MATPPVLDLVAVVPLVPLATAHRHACTQKGGSLLPHCGLAHGCALLLYVFPGARSSSSRITPQLWWPLHPLPGPDAECPLT